MKAAKIAIRSDDDAVIDDAARRFVDAWNASKSEEDIFTFSSPAQLFTVLTPKRWTMSERLQKSGPLTYRALATLLERDVKRVHDDATALIEWGLVAVHEDGGIYVPYDVIRAGFDLKAAA
jgi:predicted transcriptional regulator